MARLAIAGPIVLLAEELPILLVVLVRKGGTAFATPGWKGSWDSEGPPFPPTPWPCQSTGSVRERCALWMEAAYAGAQGLVSGLRDGFGDHPTPSAMVPWPEALVLRAPSNHNPCTPTMAVLHPECLVHLRALG